MNVKTFDQLSKDLNGEVDELDEASLLTNFIVVESPSSANRPSKPLKLRVNMTKRHLDSMAVPVVYRLNDDFTLKTKIESQIVEVGQQQGQVAFDVRHYGTYVVKMEENDSSLVSAMIGVAVLVAIAVVITIFLVKNPTYITQIRYAAVNTKRSLSNKV